MYKKYYQRSAGGQDFSFEIRGGELWATGFNFYGQLGDGTTTNKYTPVRIGTDTNWVSVCPGGFHTLALKSDGTLWAWGRNSKAQLGDYTTTSRLSPVRIGNSNDWVSIGAGFQHSFAIKSNGTLWCWGDDFYGQAGNGFTFLTIAQGMGLVDGSTNWVNVVGGLTFSMGLKADGSLWVWGRNDYGQLGNGTTSASITASSPTRIGTSNNWVRIAAGNNHALALKSDGTLWAWGDNFYGQLGNGTNAINTTPVQVGTADNWVSISAGEASSYGLKADGTLWGWGYNTDGRVGDGTTTSRNSPVQITTSANWVNVNAGRTHVTALKADGSLWSWGWNASGQLGDGTSTSSNIPVNIYTLSDRWLNMDSRNASAVALKSNGTLWTWGANGYGELGDGTTSNRSTPQQVQSATNWTAISGGSGYTFGIQANGTLWGWGNNANGQLGNAGPSSS